jgi:hypothetical protein
MDTKGYKGRLRGLIQAKSLNTLACLIMLLTVVVFTVGIDFRKVGYSHPIPTVLLASSTAGFAFLVSWTLFQLGRGRLRYMVSRNSQAIFVSLSVFLSISAALLSDQSMAFQHRGIVLLYLSSLFTLLLTVQYLMLKRSNLAFFIARTFLAVLFFLEGMYFLQSLGEQPWRQYQMTPLMKTLRNKDDSLGWSMKSDLETRLVKHDTAAKDTAYDIFLATDDKGFRDSSFSRNGVPRRRINLFGCSFTFGTGSHFEETIGYQLEQLDTTLSTVNRGVGGYGPHQMLVQIIRMDAEECNGDAVYTYIPDHHNRVWGGTTYLSWGSGSPDVYIEGDSIILKKRNAAWIFLNNLLFASRFAELWRLRYYAPSSEAYMKRFASIINKSAAIYLEKNPQARFFVGIYPIRESSTANHKKNLRWLKHMDKRIKVIDVESMSLSLSIDKKEYFQNDGHPRGKMNRLYADSLRRHF